MAPDNDDEQGRPPPPIKRTGDSSLNRAEERRSMREQKTIPRSSPPESPPLQGVNWLIISILSFVISAVFIALISFMIYIILRYLGIL
jgi:hypothetical protein